LLTDQSFSRLYGRFKQFVPVGRRDIVVLRAELGGVFTAGRAGAVPPSLLFRTGGNDSVRGYSYQSIGNEQNGTVYPTKYLAVGSSEYQRWFSEKWGAAVFYDMGAAADNWNNKTFYHGVGTGARWCSPVGTLNLTWPMASRSARSGRTSRWASPSSVARTGASPYTGFRTTTQHERPATSIAGFFPTPSRRPHASVRCALQSNGPHRPHPSLERRYVAVLVLAPLVQACMPPRPRAAPGSVWNTAVKTLEGKLSGQLLGGTIADGLRLRDLHYQDEKRILDIDSVEARWHLARCNAGSVSITCAWARCA
jgi:hypothetical protein